MSVRPIEVVQASRDFSLRDVVGNRFGFGSPAKQAEPVAAPPTKSLPTLSITNNSLPKPQSGLKFNLSSVSQAPRQAQAAPASRIKASAPLEINFLSKTKSNAAAELTGRADTVLSASEHTGAGTDEEAHQITETTAPKKRGILGAFGGARPTGADSEVLRLTAYVDDLTRKLRKTQTKLDASESQLAKATHVLHAERQNQALKLRSYKHDLIAARDTETKLRAELAMRPEKAEVDTSKFNKSVDLILEDEMRIEESRKKAEAAAAEVTALEASKSAMEQEIANLKVLKERAAKDIEEIKAAQMHFSQQMLVAKADYETKKSELDEVKAALCKENAKRVSAEQASIDVAKIFDDITSAEVAPAAAENDPDCGGCGTCARCVIILGDLSAENGVVNKNESTPEPEQQPEPDPEPGPEAESKPKLESEPEPEPEPEPDPEPESESTELVAAATELDEIEALLNVTKENFATISGDPDSRDALAVLHGDGLKLEGRLDAVHLGEAEGVKRNAVAARRKTLVQDIGALLGEMEARKTIIDTTATKAVAAAELASSLSPSLSPQPQPDLLGDAPDAAFTSVDAAVSKAKQILHQPDLLGALTDASATIPGPIGSGTLLQPELLTPPPSASALVDQMLNGPSPAEPAPRRGLVTGSFMQDFTIGCCARVAMRGLGGATPLTANIDAPATLLHADAPIEGAPKPAKPDPTAAMVTAVVADLKARLTELSGVEGDQREVAPLA